MTGWRELTPGTRVVVRRRLTDDERRADPTGPHFTDAIGVVVRVDDEGLELETRGGPLAVPGALVTRCKPVPPPPARRPRRGSGGDDEHAG